MSVYVTGDKHGNVDAIINAFHDNHLNIFKDKLIILGDVGLNYYGNNTDKKKKQRICDEMIEIYCVRGNHEMRPEDVLSMQRFWDEELHNYTYVEPDYPFINYLIDGEDYHFEGFHCLVIGGAYSVDKYYRLQRAQNEGVYAGWFENEQLTKEEMDAIYWKVRDRRFDFIFTHTCPYFYQPTDLFLPQVDQSMVDNTMEKFLDTILMNTYGRRWLFGHYHKDRIIAPDVEMLYNQVIKLRDINEYWYTFHRIKNKTQKPVNFSELPSRPLVDFSPIFPFWDEYICFDK